MLDDHKASKTRVHIITENSEIFGECQKTRYYIIWIQSKIDICPRLKNLK